MNVTRTFKALDHDGEGTLPSGGFRQAMRNFGLPVSSNEADVLINHFDPTGKGEIDYMAFVKYMQGSASPKRRRRRPEVPSLGLERERAAQDHFVLVKADVREALRAAASGQALYTLVCYVPY